MNQKILKKKERLHVFPKFQWNFRICEKCFYFTLKWFLLNSFGEMYFLEENYKNKCKNSNFDIFESTFYMKSGSIQGGYSQPHFGIGVQPKGPQMGLKAKKNNCCVALKCDFWKSWVGRSENYFFLNNFFKKHPKGPNLGAYSIIFLKKHPIWAKLGAFPTLLF